MIGVRLNATGPRSMDGESHKRARVDDPLYCGSRTAGMDVRPEKKMQLNTNLHQQRQRPQQNYHLSNLLQQRNSHLNASGNASLCQSLLQGAAAVSRNTATPSSITSDAVQHTKHAIATAVSRNIAAPSPTTVQLTRPKGVFDFPWQKERLALDIDGWNFRDVFFSSLVDGCSARIGLPGDRLSRRAAPFTVQIEDFPWTLTRDHDEPDGSIWSSALQHPLLAAGGFSPASAGIGNGTSDWLKLSKMNN